MSRKRRSSDVNDKISIYGLQHEYDCNYFIPNKKTKDDIDIDYRSISEQYYYSDDLSYICTYDVKNKEENKKFIKYDESSPLIQVIKENHPFLYILCIIIHGFVLFKTFDSGIIFIISIHMINILLFINEKSIILLIYLLFFMCYHLIDIYYNYIE